MARAPGSNASLTFHGQEDHEMTKDMLTGLGTPWDHNRRAGPSGSRNLASIKMYCQIYKLPFILKNLEKLVHMQLKSFLDEHNVLDHRVRPVTSF